MPQSEECSVLYPLLSLQDTNEEDVDLSPEYELRKDVRAALDDDVDHENEEPWHFRCLMMMMMMSNWL